MNLPYKPTRKSINLIMSEVEEAIISSELKQKTEMFWLLQLQFLELSGTALRDMFFDVPDMRYPQCILKNQVTEHEKLATVLAYHFAGVEE